MIALQKPIKMLFISSKKLFSFSRYSIFVFLNPLLFFPVGHCFKASSKINLKVYEVINGLNNLQKEKRYDTEILSINRVFVKVFVRVFVKVFVRVFVRVFENVHQKLVPDSFHILVNNLKQPLHGRNSFKIKIF